MEIGRGVENRAYEGTARTDDNIVTSFGADDTKTSFGLDNFGDQPKNVGSTPSEGNFSTTLPLYKGGIKERGVRKAITHPLFSAFDREDQSVSSVRRPSKKWFVIGILIAIVFIVATAAIAATLSILRGTSKLSYSICYFVFI